MSGNRVVVYKGPGEVAVESVDYPKLEIPREVAGPLRHQAGRTARGDPQAGHHQHLRLRPAHGARSYDGPGRPVARPRDHRRGGRGRRRRALRQGGRHLLGAVQHRLRPLPDVLRGQDRHLPQRQPGARRSGVRLRRHGRLGRRPGRVRDDPVRRLQPAAVPRPRPGAGEDPRPDDALRHLPDRLPRRLHRRRDHRLDRLRRRRRPGRPGRGPRRPAARCLGRDRRRHERRPARPGAQLRLRDRRPELGRRAARPDRAARSASPRSTPPSTPWASRPAATARVPPRPRRPCSTTS